MSLKKTVAIAAAAGALAAISVPAMAFENEAHGYYSARFFLSNADNGGSNYVSPGATNATLAGAAVTAGTYSRILDRVGTYLSVPTNSLTATPSTGAVKTNNYFEQRARLQYIAKASDDLRLVTHFEIDSVWGDRAQGGAYPAAYSTAPTVATRGSGGAMEADSVNLETKQVYLDFKIPSTPIRMTVGIQPIQDKFKGVFLYGTDLAGINTVSKLGPATLGVGYFRAYDQSYFGTGRPVGADSLHIGALSVDYAVNKDVNVGLAYYLYADDRNDTTVAWTNANNTTLNLHVIGANFDAKLGALGLSGFAAMQQGKLKGNTTNVSYNGYAFNLAAKMAAGPGTLRTAALWTTGDDGRDGVNTGWQGVMLSQNAPATFGSASSGCNSYVEANMMLLNRSLMSGGSTDIALIYSTNNKDQGHFLYTLGYDAKLGAKAYANANVGMAWASKTNNLGTVTATGGLTTNRPVNYKDGGYNGSNYMGTEINVETGYKLYDNLTARFQAAYLILGGYYAGTVMPPNATTSTAAKDPDNPFTVRTGLTYTF